MTRAPSATRLLSSLIAEMRQWSDISNHEWDLLVRGTTPALHEFLVDHSREKIAAILDDHARLKAALETAEQRDELVVALCVARKELEHAVPYACYATGPSTGDPIQDLVVCPGCSALRQIDAALAKVRG